METLEAIAGRRSIRKFLDRPVEREDIEAVLETAIQAPSGKNRQPWRFVVVADQEQRMQMIRVMLAGIAASKLQGRDTGTAIMTARVMEHAPVTVFVFNPEGRHPWTEHSIGQIFQESVDTQSIGAAIENMLLAAQEKGLATLWMCDVWSAYEQLIDWLGEPGQLIAAVALGYAAEQPPARPRRTLTEVVRWL